MGENPELIAMADRIAREFAPYDDTATGCAIATVVRKAILAAIIETQERDATMAMETPVTFRTLATYTEDIRKSIAAAIRSGKHYGKDQPHE